MNERVEALAGQAFQFAADNADETGKGQLGVFAEKFAELIVRECVNVLDKAQWDKGEDWVCADGTRIISQIKEHFGVER